MFSCFAVIFLPAPIFIILFLQEDKLLFTALVISCGTFMDPTKG